MRRSVYGFRRNESGAALVELALTFPFLLLLGAGLAEFGLMLNQQQVIEKSVRDAARYAARTPYAFKTCPLNGQPEWTPMVADTKDIALSGNIAGTPFLISTWNNPSMVAVVDSCVAAGTFISPAGGGNNIPVITVTASAPYAGIGFLSFLGMATFNLTAQHSEMWAGL